MNLHNLLNVCDGGPMQLVPQELKYYAFLGHNKGIVNK
jgi:hypothetical protein